MVVMVTMENSGDEIHDTEGNTDGGQYLTMGNIAHRQYFPLSSAQHLTTMGYTWRWAILDGGPILGDDG
jgi:hypothetical protein